MTNLPRLPLSLLLLLVTALFHPLSARAHGTFQRTSRPPSAQTADDHEHGASQKTIWSDMTEVFMEYDPPISGRLGGFLLHLTDLETFKPMSQARVVLTLTGPDGRQGTASMRFTGRPGIFQGTIAPSQAGLHRFSLSVEGPTFYDVIAYDNIMVSKRGQKPADEEPHGDQEGDIDFLKEQQWLVEFRIRRIEERSIAPTLVVTGELVPNPIAEGLISAPLAGMVAFDLPLPHPGQRVKKGQALCHIAPPISQDGGAEQLTAQFAEANSRVLLAKKEFKRARRLFEGKAAPRKRLEEAEIMLKTAEAALVPLRKALDRVKSNVPCRHLVLRSPMAGTVVDVHVINGAYVQAGQPLMRVIDTSKLWLKANIPMSAITHLERLNAARFTITGIEGEFRPSRLVTVSDIIDPKTRMVKTLMEVDNPNALLKIGMFATVFLQAGHAEEVLAVPSTAIFEDEGKHFVYVQVGGETFRRKEVALGNRDGAYTAIIKGLSKGDRVVTIGGYYVKQASLQGNIPAGHGHEH